MRKPSTKKRVVPNRQSERFVRAAADKPSVRKATITTTRFSGRRSFAFAKAGRRRDLDNRYFRSSWEANYARYLNLCVKQRSIQSWDYETRTFEFPVKRGNRFYLPDFEVTMPDGSIEYIEVKGYMDAASKTKIKRLRKYYPSVKLTVIDRAKYKEIERFYSDQIKGWER